MSPVMLNVPPLVSFHQIDMTSQFFCLFSFSFSSSLTATLHYAALSPSREYISVVSGEISMPKNKKGLIRGSNRQKHT